MSLEDLRTWADTAQAESGKVLVGLEPHFDLMLTALLTGGHVLLEGVPGTAKTLMAKTLAHLVQAQFTRVQFTPDLMPSDLLGTSVFDMATGRFNLKRGPLFTQVLLADEINRAPAKTQSALLEAMEERQINLDGVRHELPRPFMVVATQNPIEYEGTYPLPEAQLDRFLFKIVVSYAALESEVEVLRRYHHGFDAHALATAGLQPVFTSERLATARQAIQTVTVEDGILTYIARLGAATRGSTDILLGVSTRAATWLLLAAKTFAALRGRDFVTPDDVKFLAVPAWRHRLILRPEAEIEGLDADAVLARVLAQVDVPR
jgi:MoxR-like ATPase